MTLITSQPMEIGTSIPSFSLKDTSGNDVTPETFTDKKGLLVVFTCNHCPYAKASWPILIKMAHEHTEIGFIAISANDAESYPDDGPEAMKEKKEEWGIPFPYAHDETQEVAQLFHAQCTPDPFLFRWDSQNEEFVLFYHGRINDNWQHEEEAKELNLTNAIHALLLDEKPPQEQPPSMGCSIKWKE